MEIRENIRESDMGEESEGSLDNFHVPKDAYMKNSDT